MRLDQSEVLLIYATAPDEFACPLKGPTPGTLSVGSSGRIPKSTALNSVAGTRSDGENANTGNGAYYVAKITICFPINRKDSVPFVMMDKGTCRLCKVPGAAPNRFTKSVSECLGLTLCR